MQALLNWLLRHTPWGARTWIKHVPGLAQLQRALVSATFDGKAFVHQVDAGPAKGVRFLVTLPDDKPIWTGAYESEFASRLADAIVPGSVALDIGGWHGFFAAVMAARGARVVHVFEPLPENAQRIATLAELNPNLDIRLHAFAVADQDGECEFMVMPNTSMAKLARSSFQEGRTPDRSISVNSRRLDTLVSGGLVDPPDVIKLDVEGAEAFVLRGASKVLRENRPLVFAEVHSPALMDECSAILTAHGYKITRIDSDRDPARKPDGFQIFARPV